ncbi:MAG: peptidoglycan editing factor PgeF [Treponema sp.]|nr:peptidoglycan editing factor PgeF [Treponema sp.]
MRTYPFNLDFTNDNNNLPFFASFPFIFDDRPIEGISCGISSRLAGDMKNHTLNKNRLNLFSKLGLNTANVYGLKQIHSRNVLVVNGSTPPLIEADGMVTQDRDRTLSVTVADCLPVFLYDTKTASFAIVHSGWKGTGIVVDVIDLMMEKYLTNPCDIAAVLGPCIGCCCYKVDAERAVFFEKEFGIESVRKSNEDFFLDLKAANVKLLNDIGVNNIAVCNNCTFCDERLGSFRREGAQFTHMIALIYSRR